MTPTLTIICPSFRTQFLDVRLQEQVRKKPYQDQVELLILNDNDWASIGRKHRRLVEMARGTFIMGMGDDDILSPRLLPMVLQRLTPRVQGLSFDILMIPPNGPEAICSVNPADFKDRKDLTPYWNMDGQHRPWHPIMPTRRELFNEVNWTNVSWGEDEDLLQQISPKVISLPPREFPHLDATLYLSFPRIDMTGSSTAWKLRYGDRDGQ